MRSRNHRRLRVESLERRQLLAGDVAHNFIQPLDVNDDATVSSIDALAIINHINRRQLGQATVEPANTVRFLDVNDDAKVSPLDALRVVNWLNRSAQQTEIATRAARVINEVGSRASVQLTDDGATQALRIRAQNLEPGSTHEVFIEGEWLGFAVADDEGRAEVKFDSNSESLGSLPGRIFDGLSNARLRVEGVGEMLIERLDEVHRSSDDEVVVLKAILEQGDNTVGRVLAVQTDDYARILLFARGLDAGSSYDLTIDGITVASLQANRAGVIAANLSGSDLQLPVVSEGSSVELTGVGGGVFIPFGRDWVNPPRPEVPTLLVTTFTSESRLRGGASVLLGTEHLHLALTLWGAEAGNSYSIAIDGQEFATVRANRLGAILFHFDSRSDSGQVSDPLPTIAAGSVISIGDLARGTLTTVRDAIR